jgi:hypothetical protein
MGTLDQSERPFYHRRRQGSTATLGAVVRSVHQTAPGARPGAVGAFDMWARCYLFAGSFACLTRNLRMLLMPSCARRVLAGALRTLARSLALCVAFERLAPGV